MFSDNIRRWRDEREHEKRGNNEQDTGRDGTTDTPDVTS